MPVWFLDCFNHLRALLRTGIRGTVVSFGLLETDGMVSIREENGQWVLRPFPRSRNFTVRLQRARFAMPAAVLANGGSSPGMRPVAEGTYWRLPLTGAKELCMAGPHKERVAPVTSQKSSEKLIVSRQPVQIDTSFTHESETN